MAAPKSKAGVRSGAGRRARTAGKSSFTTTAFFIGLDGPMPKGAAGFKLKVPNTASEVLTTNSRKPMKALLQRYVDAIAKSRADGRRVSFRVAVGPEGGTIVAPFEEVIAAPESLLEGVLPVSVLRAARERARRQAADILGGNDMLSGDAFAKVLGTTRVTVNTKRRSGQLLGVHGTKRGFRFPIWQLNDEGKPYAELPMLHEMLGGPWAVFRFLVNPHGELGGLTGRKALERGKVRAVLAAAASVGRDFG